MLFDYYTSDHHFRHHNIIQYCQRPFVDVVAMDTEMIRAWNDTVGPHQRICHLGDVTLCGTDLAQYYFGQLNGYISVLGNPWHHDKKWIDADRQFFSASGHPVRILPPLVVLEDRRWAMSVKNGRSYPQVIALCHYQMAVWDRAHYGAWHLFAHSHGRRRGEGLSIDVGVDNAYGLFGEFRPFRTTDIAEIMHKRGR